MPGREDHWRSRVGIILAVAGGAVGIGNFLRFPGRAALYGGGAFLIPYFVSLVVIGIPLAWIEWTIGRTGARRGVHDPPGLFDGLWHSPLSRVFGSLAVFIPLVVFAYYVFIAGWCGGYAWIYLTGGFDPPADPSAWADYFGEQFDLYVGTGRDGALFEGFPPALVALVVAYAINLFLVWEGISKGIETFCRWAMPALIVAALVILVRVLTLGTPNPEMPDRNLDAALGFMWNPKPLVEGGSLYGALADATVWIEAAGQIFFSIGIGFGLILCYASYLHPDDDVTLNGLTSVATNELCEVCLGGMITIPAAFLFLGAAPLAAVAGSSLGLGFHAVPVVFQYLPFGQLFGFLWFGLLFLAAMTSAVAMLQPPVAFFEGGLGFSRGRAVAATGAIAFAGTVIVVWFSRNTIALDVMDFWVGTVALVVLALFEVVLFGWVVGADRGVDEANRSSDFHIPRAVGLTIRWVCPVYLAAILGNFAWSSFPDQARALVGSPGAIVAALYLLAVLVGFAVLAERAGRRGEASR